MVFQMDSINMHLYCTNSCTILLSYDVNIWHISSFHGHLLLIKIYCSNNQPILLYSKILHIRVRKYHC